MTLLEAAATTLMSKVASAIEEGRARATEQTEPLGAPPTTKSEEVVDVTTVKDITENVTADVAEDEIPAPVDAAPSNEPQEVVSVPNADGVAEVASVDVAEDATPESSDAPVSGQEETVVAHIVEDPAKDEAVVPTKDAPSVPSQPEIAPVDYDRIHSSFEKQLMTFRDNLLRDLDAHIDAMSSSTTIMCGNPSQMETAKVFFRLWRSSFWTSALKPSAK